ncbi:hypothetical protein Ahy_A03g015253 isoform B [Arachis hypogaea]|uniref:Uncharacterized protein n=1 Tax=Arachis hypogaea TaxID=3818 RepID=A0A445E055_ARAHY|nr:hypothetical protein Ahy_A03g015253 isoform B [Arachis hypogaea]
MPSSLNSSWRFCRRWGGSKDLGRGDEKGSGVRYSGSGHNADQPPQEGAAAGGKIRCCRYRRRYQAPSSRQRSSVGFPMLYFCCFGHNYMTHAHPGMK